MLEELVHVVDLVLLCIGRFLRIFLVMDFDGWVLDVRIRVGVLGSAVFRSRCLMFLLGVFDHMLDGVL